MTSSAEKNRAATRRWREANPERAQEVAARYHQKNRERINEAARKRQALLRTLVFDHYGWTCTCCGTADRPTIDHVNGDGREHREELFGRRDPSGTPMYRWLIKNGFPVGFQTLCRPCNISKNRGAGCRIDHGGGA